MNQSQPVKTIYGTQMYLDEQDSLGIGLHGYYEIGESALIHQLLKPTDIALDIGAHIGYFTLMMAKRCKKVVAFEPYKPNFEILQKNIELNELFRQVFELSAAASNHWGFADLHICDSNSGMHRLYKTKWASHIEPVPCMAIGDFVDDATFIKMDIEGAELGALKGMTELLERNHPIILMEFHPKSIREYGADPEEEYHLLKSLGYDIKLLPDKEHSISYKDLIKETDKAEWGRNILCHYEKH